MRLILARWRLREWLVLALAAELAAVSFLDWWAASGRVDSYQRALPPLLALDAWHASSRWAAGVLLGISAALLWVLHRSELLPARWVGGAVVVLLALALAAAAWGWLSIPRLGISTPPGSLDKAGRNGFLAPIFVGVTRDHLFIYHGSNVEMDVRPPLYVGLLTLAAELTGVASAYLPRRPASVPR